MAKSNNNQESVMPQTSVLVPEVPPSKGSLIPLSTTTALQRWFQQRMAIYSSAKETFVLVSLLLLGFVGGPALVFYCMSWLLQHSLGTSGGGAAALAFNAVLYLLLLLVLCVLGLMIFNKMRKPTHLLTDEEGVQFLYHTLLGRFKGRKYSWSKIDRMEIFKPGNTVNPNRYVLRFLEGASKVFDIPLNWIDNSDSRDQLACAVKEHLGNAQRDLEVALYLQPPLADSFTEIWFQSLPNTPYIEGLLAPDRRVDKKD